MRAYRSRRAALLVLMAGPIGLAIAACDGVPAGTPPGRDAVAAVVASRDEADAAAPRRVSINNFKYDPATLTVPVGTKVVWTNRDDMPHTVTSPGAPRALDSAALDTDDEFSFVFDRAGTFDYFCTVHPKMTGRVIVK